MKQLCTVTVFSACVAVVSGAHAGERPYEMVWAERTQDIQPALVDFEDVSGWTVETENAVATLEQSEEQQLWGKGVAKLTYRCDAGRPRILLRPPEPVAVTGAFDCVHFWVYGNNWGHSVDVSTPRVQIRLLFESGDGDSLTVDMGDVRWQEWWCTQRKLRPEQIVRARDGALFTGIEITKGTNKRDRVIYLDNLACYVEPLRPLSFKPRRKRGVDPFPGQSSGTNTGPGRLPFPTREETILPDSPAGGVRTSLAGGEGGFVFRYEADDGVLEYRYQPKTGTLGDVTARWQGRGGEFRPMQNGGLRFHMGGRLYSLPARAELVSCRREGDAVFATWTLHHGDRTAVVTYAFRLWQKSLVVDVMCPGGDIGRVDFGQAADTADPRLVEVPFLTGDAQRPAILVTGPPSEPVFLSGFVDYYRTHCSKLWFANRVKNGLATYNGGTEYIPKTDGTRNDCFERLFLTMSPRFEEVLPNIPNPKSPWMHVTGERVWRAHGAGNREHDLAFWQSVVRHGMTKILVTDHETGWRDGGESFTFRTRAAPGKGGDESQAWYAREMIGLGLRYGIYNQYTDLASVNEYWHPDRIIRTPAGDWLPAWARCHRAKPASGVEYAAVIAPEIQRKFGLNTAYCDVHTCITPWHATDYDARVPGAGTMAATFYAFGEIMLSQKETWDGPVYSEGNHHWYYSGLTDGNYGQDRSGMDLVKKPWLVDFDLRKMHPLNCNFGLGNPGMLFGKTSQLGDTPEERTRNLDLFLAGTLAFGHTGFLVRQLGMPGMARSYFMVQQVHANYARETVESIRYRDDRDELLDTSAAVASGAYARSQIVTRYSNGMTVIVNGHDGDVWYYAQDGLDVLLPPYGYAAVLAGDGNDEPRIHVFSGLAGGQRVDYAHTPDYVFADGRGEFARFADIATDGPLIVLRLDAGNLEAIPVQGCTEFAVSAGGRRVKARALDVARNELGPVDTRVARGLVHVFRRDGVFSYILTPEEEPPVILACDRDTVVPGDRVVVRGREAHEVQVPPDATPGARHWVQLEDEWIDFTVVPLVELTVEVRDPVGPERRLAVHVASNLAGGTEGRLSVLGGEAGFDATPGAGAVVEIAMAAPTEAFVHELPVEVRIGGRVHRETWWLKAEETELGIAEFAWSDVAHTGMRLRGEEEGAFRSGERGHVNAAKLACGGTMYEGIFMHPPWTLGVGYSFAELAPTGLPAHVPAMFRCLVGRRDGGDPGDGILFRVVVADGVGKQTVLAEKQWAEHEWTELSGDLSPWAGQTVGLKLISDVGPNDDATADWACWAEPRIESRDAVMALSVHRDPQRLRYEPSPHPLRGVTVADLRSVQRGWLHYGGIGISGGKWRCNLLVCGVDLGQLPGTAGTDERLGVWGEEASVPLPAAVLAKLDLVNEIRLDNAGQDCFKVRGFWMDLELADGRRCSSQVSTSTITQPETWLYAEGDTVPFGQDIVIRVKF